MSAPDEKKRSMGSKQADAAIAKSKKTFKPAPLPKPEKGGKPKKIGDD
jgi:hypothetical protein